MLDALGYYTLLDRIGVGGLGDVYRARDTRTGRTVVIRLLPDALTDDPVKRAAFLEAARRAANLSHPNVAALFEIGEDGSRLFLVYEHVAGEGLPLLLAERPMKVGRAVEFAIQLADALAEGHAQGVVHGDIRPDKILVTKTGHAKLLDFGVAAFGGGGAARMALPDGLGSGSVPPSVPVEYMAPEQILGAAGDARTDVYCLAVVLYEMLTGRPPFKAARADETAVAILRSPAPSAMLVNEDVPPRLDQVLQRALSKSLDSRPQSAAEFAAYLRQAADAVAPSDALPSDDAGAGSPRAAGSRRWLVVAGLLLAVGAAGWLSSDALARGWRRWFVAPPPPVLAVIPIETQGENRPQPYFVRGVVAELAERFGHTPGFTVVGRSSGLGGQDAISTARGTEAAAILSAGVETAADTITVDATLRDAARGDELWSGRLTRPRAEVLALQTDLVDRVAERLAVPVTATPQRVRTASRAVDSEGYDLFLQGREALALDDPARAAALFRRASLADPLLAEAHASYVVAAHALGVSTATLDRELMRRAAASAAAVDADLAVTQLAAGLAAESSAEAARHFRRALEIDPSAASVLSAVGDELAALDPARALDFHRAAARLDPQHVPAQVGLIRIRARLGQGDAAVAELSANAALSRQAAGRALSLLLRAEADPASVTLPHDWMPQPAHALKLAMALGSARPDVAGPLASEALRTSAGYCEAQAVVAAFDLDGGSAEARGELVTASASPNVICGALAGAALRDPVRVASSLRAIADRPAWLRAWTRQIGGESMSETLRAGRFPWSRITGEAAGAAAPAIEELDRALAAARTEISETLRGLPRD
jgi:serine/threonine-protein kinase